jgi:hypothetical protein
MTTVNPVQMTTYYLTSGNNPITFGSATGIDVSSASGIGVYGSNVQSSRSTQARSPTEPAARSAVTSLVSRPGAVAQR